MTKQRAPTIYNRVDIEWRNQSENGTRDRTLVDLYCQSTDWHQVAKEDGFHKRGLKINGKFDYRIRPRQQCNYLITEN